MNTCLLCNHPIDPACDVCVGPKGHVHALCEARGRYCITAEGAVDHDDVQVVDREWRGSLEHETLEVRRQTECGTCHTDLGWSGWTGANEDEYAMRRDEVECEAEQSAMDTAEELERGL